MKTENAKRPPFAWPWFWAVCLGMSASVGAVLSWMLWGTYSQFGWLEVAFAGAWAGFLGFFGGLFLGSLVWLFKVRVHREVWALGVATFFAFGGGMYLYVPEPSYKGHMIQGEVLLVEPLSPLLPAVMEEWDSRTQARPWKVDRPRWREASEAMLAQAEREVLTVRVLREWQVFMCQAPWNRGELRLEPVTLGDEQRRYLVRVGLDTVGGHPVGKTTLYTVGRKLGMHWPPETLGHFLQMYLLEVAPAAYRDLVPDLLAD